MGGYWSWVGVFVCGIESKIGGVCDLFATPLCTLLQPPLLLAIAGGHDSVVTALMHAKADTSTANTVRGPGGCAGPWGGVVVVMTAVPWAFRETQVLLLAATCNAADQALSLSVSYVHMRMNVRKYTHAFVHWRSYTHVYTSVFVVCVSECLGVDMCAGG